MSSPLRILFLAQHAEHLRMFESGLSELARRGHTLCLAFPALERSTLVADRLARQFPNVTVDPALPPYTRQRALNVVAGRMQIVRNDLRYLSPQYASYGVVRGESERRYPAPLRAILRRIAARPWAAGLMAEALGAVERRLPFTAAARKFLADHPADLVLATPLVTGPYLIDYVRLAQARGLPTGLPVRSWDNLTTKGVLHVIPDGLIVWNEPQRREAVEEFQIPADRIAVVGAQCFDHWFAQTMSARADFCASVGLSTHRPYLLYVASSARVATTAEPAFVSTWLRAMRAHADPRVRDMQVLIRPHFQNADPWRGWTPPVPDVVVSPPLGEMPVDERSRRAFYDAMAHSVAVVGANTSAMIEAGIAGRPVLSIITSLLGQETMPHFHHLITHGLIESARTFDEHFGHVIRALDAPHHWDMSRARFLTTFVRPHGLDRPAAPYFADAVEALMRFSKAPRSR